MQLVGANGKAKEIEAGEQGEENDGYGSEKPNPLRPRRRHDGCSRGFRRDPLHV